MSGLFAGRWQLLRLLGEGGMGEVWLARDHADGTERALKRLRAGASPEAARRLQREFEVIAALRHPALVRVHELGFTPAGEPYLAMEFVPGLPADRVLPRGDSQALGWFAARAARALAALHGAGVVHGDLKPSNLLVVPGEPGEALPRELRLVDLGLGSLRGEGALAGAGTPGYAAPELHAGRPADAATDLYALGATLYALITGVPASRGASRDGDGAGGAPAFAARPLEEAGAGGTMVRLVLGLLAGNPAERPASAIDVAREIESLRRGTRRPLAARLETEVFTGRERELGAFAAALAQSSQATPSSRPARPVLLIEGEAGAGKSALLEQFALRASAEGRVVLRVDPAASSPAPALRRLAAAAGEAAGGAGAAPGSPLRGVLARADAPLPAAARAEALSAAAGWLAAIATAGATAVLLVDGADALNDGDRRWWLELQTHDACPPLVGVWAARDLAAAGETFALLAASGLARRTELAPLERGEVERLAAARLGDAAPDELVEFLWARAAGLPASTVGLLRAAAASGALFERDMGQPGLLALDVSQAKLEALPSPAGAEEAALGLARELPPDARALLTSLAACGGSAPAAELAAVAERPGAGPTPAAVARIEAALAPALALRLVRVREGRFAFARPSLGARWMEERPGEERRAAWRAALERPGADDAERFRLLCALGEDAAALGLADTLFERAPELALAAAAAALAGRAGDAGRAATWHERAGDEAVRRARLSEAVPHYEQALEGAGPPEARGRRAYELALCYRRLARGPELEALVGRMGPEVPPSYAARLVMMGGFARTMKGDSAGARAEFERALRMADAGGDPEAIVICQVQLSYGVRWDGRCAEGEALARGALRIARDAAWPLGEVRALQAVAGATRDQNRHTESLAALDEALAICLRVGDEAFAVELAALKAHTLLDAGGWTEARDFARARLPAAVRAGSGRACHFLLETIALVDMYSGRARAARAGARRLVRLAYLSREVLGPIVTQLEGGALHRVGRPAPAMRVLRRPLARGSGDASSLSLLLLRIEYASAALACERWRDAADALAALPDPAGTPEGAIAAVLRARALLRTGDEPRAKELCAGVEALLARSPRPWALAHLETLRAELAIAGGRTSDARAAAAAALRSHGALPSPCDRAEAALAFAALALAHGRERDLPADAWAADACATFERIGNRPSRLRALELRLELARRAAAEGMPGAEGDDRDLYESLAALLRSLTDPRLLARRALDLAARRFGAERGALLLWDPESGTFSPLADFGGLDPQALEQARGWSHRAVEHVHRTGQSLVLSDAYADAPFSSESVMRLRLRSILCVPLAAEGRPLGALYLDDSRRAGAFSDQERGLLEGLAHMLGTALADSLHRGAADRTAERLLRENIELRAAAGEPVRAGTLLIGESTAIRRIQSQLEQLASVPTSVLISGETGTGKDLVARTLHHQGPRSEGPYVAVNCGAFPESMLEAELFGTAAGAATGVRERAGVFERAHGGTVFLDEIGDMPLRQQVALLRVLNDREVTRVGGSKPVAVDVRVIAATNRDLPRLVDEGRFREDLYFRLAVVPLVMPPLRSHKSDIPLLARHFVEFFAGQMSRPVPAMSREFIATLVQSDWPGNVRELMNYVERIVAMTPAGVLQPSPLPRDLEERHGAGPLPRERKYREALAQFERRLIERALKEAGENQNEAARQLGLPEPTLRYRIARLFPGRTRKNLRTRRNPR